MKTFICLGLAIPLLLFSQQNSVTIHMDKPGHTISKHIYGQFSEHLGRGVYGGVWVGYNSDIPNTRGIRNDVVKALREINVPNVRWPGGCFADEYHWMDGIGDPAGRPKMVNSNWGGVTEDNSYGTHEFLDFCEQIGAEAVICGNLGSGTVQEMADWASYINSDSGTPMSKLRKANGRHEPWKVKYWCIGNESWGCGGILSAEHYANEMARYSFFMKSQGGTNLYKIASGGLPEDYGWTETIMKKWAGVDGWLQDYLKGYSLHFYTVNDWSKKGSATRFSEEEWFATFGKTLEMDELIRKHCAVMDKYDPDKKIGLVVDEWGNWFDVEPGTNSGFLYQQNSLRDALTAALNLNIFHNYERVHMANIAQMVNVLQAMILTDGEKMILTPTYYIYKMYKDFQDATYLPLDVTSEPYQMGDNEINAISASAAKTDRDQLILSLINVHASKDIDVQCNLKGISTAKINGSILTAAALNAHNTFDAAENVTIAGFSDFTGFGEKLLIKMPAKSVVILTMDKQ